MATLYVTFCDVGVSGKNGSGMLPMADGERGVSSSMTISGTNAQSGAATRNYVRIGTDAACYVCFGSNPDATVTTGRYWMPANSVEYFQIEKGNKVAAVTA